MSKDDFIPDNGTRASLEVIAPTVEEAVENGLVSLGLDEDAVDVEVLDEGSKGVFGLGSRQARVRLTIKQESIGDGVPAQPLPTEDQPAPVEITSEIQEVAEHEPPVEEEEIQTYAPIPKLDLEEEALHIARETVVDLLNRMRVEAKVETHYAEPDDERSKAPLWVDVTGNDLSVLIGHRAETLNALQYITSLIVGKELGRSVPLVVDVQGYRVRRRQEVTRLARQMADQAIRTGRRQYLEPMPANERRLVHIELRKDERVTTKSIGEEPRRKVTITPLEESDE